MNDHALYVPLSTDTELPLALVGGKMLGLNRLIRANLPVPRGFCLTTRAFETFTSPLLDAKCLAALNDPARAMEAAADLRRRMLEAPMPESLPGAARIGLKTMRNGEQADPDQIRLAVRSSATAEDLPGLSFAGQQATLLNVVGFEALMEAVRVCWASLYTERAMRYRARSGLAHDRVAMAVIVQELVPAQVAGVMFTANPLSGSRSEILINANYGLGETVVGGVATPDSFTLDRQTLATTGSELGEKALRTVAIDSGGVRDEPVPEGERAEATLDTPTLEQLGRLALAAEAAAGGEPQDLEWVLADGRIQLVQSRAITSLPPPPTEADWQPPQGMKRLFRRQVVENMSEPLSPLFEELYLAEGLDRGMDGLMQALELPVDLDDFIYRPMFVTVNGFGYLRYDIRASWRLLGTMPRILWFYLTRMSQLLRTLTQRWQDEGLQNYLGLIEQWRQIDPTRADNDQLIRGIRELTYADAAYWGYITMMVGAAKVSEGLLVWLLGSRLIPGDLSSGAFLRGFPSRTLDAQIALAKLASGCSAELRDQLLGLDTGATLNSLPATEAGRDLRAALENHLTEYGHQIFDLDFVVPPLAEQPGILITGLQALLREPDASPINREALAAERDGLSEQTAASLGPLRRRLFLKVLGWAQRFAPFREAALFYMGAAWPVLRRLASVLGERLVSADALEAPEHVFFLTSSELIEASGDRTTSERQQSLKTEALARVELREARKRLHPPARVPADVQFKFGPFNLDGLFQTFETQKRNVSDSGQLNGFAVSPGKVQAPACVIRSAEEFSKMRPGHVLVCPTTTPAWTPLFTDAAGLVTDIGAVLAHGSIVAREYGIPAVMGTGNGTMRINDGDLITVDGDHGEVILAR